MQHLAGKQFQMEMGFLVAEKGSPWHLGLASLLTGLGRTIMVPLLWVFTILSPPADVSRSPDQDVD